MIEMREPKYTLTCAQCGWSARIFQILCPRCKKEALLKTSYKHAAMETPAPAANFSSYLNYLPIDHMPDSDVDPKIGMFQSGKIADYLNLKNLHVLFSGHWPEKNAFNIVGSFKLFEAICVLKKADETNKLLILSSAGNAGRAAVQLSILLNYPVIVVIPANATGLMEVWNPHHRRSCFLIAVENGFYAEAIETVDHIMSNIHGLVREGGVYNVARRDALGAPFLRACMKMGGIPAHYFQAIGSGTGAIAALEASRRLLDASFPLANARTDAGVNGAMRLRLSQNDPFSPVARAWKNGKREYRGYSPRESRERLEKTAAQVLSNNNPPYAARGGLFDALSETSGTVDGVSNEEVRRAMDLFRGMKHVDLDPAAGVALASLKRAAKEKTVYPDDVVLLHLTGGGYDNIKRDYNLGPYPVDALFRYGDNPKPLYRAVENFVRSRRLPTLRPEPEQNLSSVPLFN